MADLALILFAVFTGILLAGALALPVVGAALAPIYVWALVKETPALRLILIIGSAAALILSRSRQRG